MTEINTSKETNFFGEKSSKRKKTRPAMLLSDIQLTFIMAPNFYYTKQTQKFLFDAAYIVKTLFKQ